MTFIQNRWYAAAWDNEISDKPLGRKILGQNIAIFRGESGKIAALESRCPHRFAPLHYGVVVGDNIKCLYHGLQFGSDGACAVNPDGSKPPKMGVKSFPVREKYSMIWIWFGEQEPSEDVPDLLNFGPHLGARIHDMLQINGNYQLVVDNLLDSAHATHLHAVFKTEGHQKSPVGEVRQEGDVIYQTIRIPNTSLIPAFVGLYEGEGNVDQTLEFKWEAPSFITVSAWVTPVGGTRENGGYNQVAAHLITPETETSCHYFWCQARSAKKDDHEYSKSMSEIFQQVFLTEDKWMVEGQEAMIEGDDFWSLKPVLLPQDKATGMCRRHNDKLIAQQEKADATI